MPISFVPLRDQNAVFSSINNSKIAKGAILRKVSSGKAISSPSDGISEYTKISSMKISIEESKNSIKEISLHSNKLDTALEGYLMLNEAYKGLYETLKEVAVYNTSTTRTKQQSEFYSSLITTKMNDVNNILDSTKFLNIPLFGNIGSGAIGKFTESNLSVKPYADIKIETNSSLLELKDPSVELTATNELKLSFGGNPAVLIINSIGAADVDKDYNAVTYATAADVAMGNYQLIMAARTSITNTEKLAKVQLTNTTAALSAIEDIDIQEEMVNLMNAQILEELGSEAMVKIKESSKYIMRLIQS